jgi:hypothetical protein
VLILRICIFSQVKIKELLIFREISNLLTLINSDHLKIHMKTHDSKKA